MEVIHLEAVVHVGGVTRAETQFIGSIILVEMWRIEYNMHG
jgi:hypothetical protein